MQLKILADTPKLIHLAMSGDFDWLSVEQIEPKFTAHLSDSVRDVIVDISGVPSITSMGIGMLITACKVVKQRGSRFVLLKPQAAVASVIQISGLSEMLCVAKDDAIVKEMLSGEIA